MGTTEMLLCEAIWSSLCQMFVEHLLCARDGRCVGDTSFHKAESTAVNKLLNHCVFIIQSLYIKYSLYISTKSISICKYKCIFKCYLYLHIHPYCLIYSLYNTYLLCIIIFFVCVWFITNDFNPFFVLTRLGFSKTLGAQDSV